MKRHSILFGAFFIFFCGRNFAQDTVSSFKISGYVDVYYAYYSDSVGTNNYQKFPDISPKSNVFGLNTAQLTAQYTAEKVRAVATFHYGDVASSAWSPVFNLIQEANAGFRLCKKVWIDAGLFRTHIGTEALMPKDNITSSLAIVTYFEPWWQAGVKLSYMPTDKFLICVHALNGYNTYVDNNSKKSFGLALNYTLGDKGNIGYYNLIGDEFPDSAYSKHLRTLHNLVFTYQVLPKLKTIVGVDYMTQQNSGLADTSATASAYSGILILKYQVKPKFGIYARGEMFSDADGFLTGVIIDNNLKNTGLILTGATLGFEYRPMDNAFLRIEARDLMMDADQLIFHTAGEKTNTNSRIEAMINFGVTF